ncbi:hypothetical protein DSCOOX_62410 [Desulfosarcina ovata subsp. ovata]|uniref:Uncharacterized protein n=1 Tax=Desulfosarcina ovata subsp. ovata TaxID=2752305 RepID=A0A5K8AK50_9BACT|nr:hypothetical protein DSCOOX_62410 [Desulfosarcina ovata subsp. ovata]
MVGRAGDRLVRPHVKGAVDWWKTTQNGNGAQRVVLLGDAGTWDERGGDIKTTEHRCLNG